MASTADGASPSNRATLWRQNTELRERNEALEREVKSLRSTVAARRLTRSSAGSVGLSPTASGLQLDRSDSGGGGAAAAAAQAQAQALEQQLAEAGRLAAQYEAALGHAREAAAAAQREAAVAAAGVASLTTQLQQSQQAAENVQAELGAAQEGLAAAEAERARQANMAAATASRLASLEAQVEELLKQAAAQEQQAQAAQPREAATAAAAGATARPSSPREYGAGPLPPLAAPPSAHATRIFSVALQASEPEPDDLRREVERLQSRIVAVEAELAAQLAAKQQLSSRLNTQAVELESLQRERELLQAQAMSLQQEVSAWQTGALLRGGASGAELAREATLERSPSRTLASRMRSLVGGSPSFSSSGSAAASPRSPAAAGGSGSRPGSPSPWAPLPPLSEGSEPGAGAAADAAGAAARGRSGCTSPPPERPLQESLQQLQASLALREGELAAQEASANRRACRQQSPTAACRRKCSTHKAHPGTADNQPLLLVTPSLPMQAKLREAQAALASAKQVYAAEAELLRGRTAAAEAAAQAVLNLHAAKVADPAAAVAGVGQGGEQAYREAVEGLYAQMWRERLGRQRAQAEAVELRLKLSSQLAAGGPSAGSSAAGAGGASGAGDGSELDEAVLQSLQAEMQRADVLADELARAKAHQRKLLRRAEQLELQLGQYNSLLVAAEGVAQVPRVAAPSGSPRGSPRSSPRGSRGGSTSSPVQAAISALQLRRAMEEVEAVRGQLRAAQAEVGGARRRERESFARRKALEGQVSELASGLVALRRLLERQGRGSGTGSAVGSPKGASRRSREGAGSVDAAMASLSALLRGLQPEEAVEGRAVVSPQASEGPGDAGVAARSLSVLLPPCGAAAEARSDPLEQLEAQASASLDVGCLLPEGAGGTPAGPATEGDTDAAGAGPTGCNVAAAAAVAECAGSATAEDEDDAGTIAAVWGSSHSQARSPAASPGRSPAASPGASPAASPSSSPGLRAKSKLGGTPLRSPAGGSPGKSRMLGWCSRPGPQATLSSGAEGGA